MIEKEILRELEVKNKDVTVDYTIIEFKDIPESAKQAFHRKPYDIGVNLEWRANEKTKK